MDVSKFLGKVIGIYLIIITVVIFIDLQLQKNLFILYNVINNPALAFVTGSFLLTIGILLIVSHNVWTFDWPIIITIIGWLTFIKSLLLLISPQWLSQVGGFYLQHANVYAVVLAVSFLIGVILCALGFKSS